MSLRIAALAHIREIDRVLHIQVRLHMLTCVSDVFHQCTQRGYDLSKTDAPLIHDLLDEGSSLSPGEANR